MKEITEIQVFVSCPGDVENEKNLVKKVCQDLNDVFLEYNIRLIVREWKTIIGQFGERPQQLINNEIRDYDIYLGIFWMRFGSKTGKKNPNTGKEYESGTEEEFMLAFDRWKTHKIPKIYLFSKSAKKNDDPNVTEQLLKVQKFIKEQKKNGWVNAFTKKNQFYPLVSKLLQIEVLKFIEIEKSERKKSISKGVSKSIKKDILEKIDKLPENYLTRTTFHYSVNRDKETIPVQKSKYKSLEQLIEFQKRSILLGDAGSGKTTELVNLYYRLIDEKSTYIPLFKKLNIYTPDLGIEKFLPSEWKKIPEEILVIIFDGLDEIQPDHFNTVVRQIMNFSTQYKDLRIIISCRTNFYELPSIDYSGTLPGFEPYIINDLNIGAAKIYYEKKYKNENGLKFIEEAYDNNINDLLGKPFFLMLLAENYNRNNSLSLRRAELYQMFILNRIEFDEHHFKNTFKLRTKKIEILRLLEKVALCMEIMAKNHIEELELLEILKSDEFEAIRYCTAFKKKDGEETIWQFEHNNIQEYLAAKGLSKLEFKEIIELVSLEDKAKKLIHSWSNTMSFLFSIIYPEEKLFNDVLLWMIENEKETLVKFEADKIPNTIRINIFKKIFTYYKEFDVWINSNKFSDKQLAEFGQSNEIIEFLISELNDIENSRTIILNATRLIGYFKFNKNRDKVKITLLKLIKENIDNPEMVHSLVYALKKGGFSEKQSIAALMDILGNNRNQYVRSAVYSILKESEVLDDYVDYIVEGDKIINKKNGTRSLIDEKFNLVGCIRKIKSPEALKKLLPYVAENNSFSYSYDTDETIEAIVSNAIDAYSKDSTILIEMLNWFNNEAYSYKDKIAKMIMSFFDKTQTRNKAFYKIWASDENKYDQKSMLLARLINEVLIDFVIAEYQNHNITNDDIDKLHRNISWVNNEILLKFEHLIEEKINFKINKPEIFDYESHRRDKINTDFNVLFNKNEYKKKIIDVFNKENKESFTYDELFEIRRNNSGFSHFEEYYSDVAIRLLRAISEHKNYVDKQTVENWFNGTSSESYRISVIYEYLTNNDLSVKSDQIQWLQKWCNKTITKVDFKNAITVNDDERINIKTAAIYIWYFTRKFDLDLPKEILLDMLSFDFIEGHEWVGIEYLIKKLSHKEIIKRMLENLKNGIEDNSVLKNHVNFLTEKKRNESYPLIVEEILNVTRLDYHRRELLDIFFNNTKDTEILKNIIGKSDRVIKWHLLEILKNNNERNFVKNFLLNESKKYSELSDKVNAAELLVELQCVEGLKLYLEIIKNDEFTSQIISANSLKEMNNINAIPYLFELLKYSYLKEINTSELYRFNSQILAAINNTSLSSEDNFKLVIDGLKKFMKNNIGLHPDVKLLVHTIENIEEQYYKNQVPSYNIYEAKDKLQKLNLI